MLTPIGKWFVALLLLGALGGWGLTAWTPLGWYLLGLCACGLAILVAGLCATRGWGG